MTGPRKTPKGLVHEIQTITFICLAGVLLTLLVVQEIWGGMEELLKYMVIGYGCLIVIGIIHSLVRGKWGYSEVAFLCFGLFIAWITFQERKQDQRSEAKVEALLADFARQETEVRRHALSLPAVPEEATHQELMRLFHEAGNPSRQEHKAFVKLNARMKKLLSSPVLISNDNRDRLHQAHQSLYEQMRTTDEKRKIRMEQLQKRMKEVRPD